MRAVVVYESMYGNTHLVADAIGAGLSTIFDVSVVPVAEASPVVLAEADLVRRRTDACAWHEPGSYQKGSCRGR